MTAACSFVLPVVAAASLMFGPAAARPEVSTEWPAPAQTEEILKRLRAELPPGASITETIPNRTPDGWYTEDHRGFEVDVQFNKLDYRIWFVPPEWLGIRPRPTKSGQHEGGVRTRDFAAIFRPLLGNFELGHILGRMNTGPRRPAEIPEADRKTQSLIQHVCQADRACRDEAAYSLVQLDVPARSAILDCAEHGSGYPQRACVGLLRGWRDAESLRILNAVAADPKTDPDTQKTAAWALKFHADPSSGPALTALFGNTSFREAAQMAADALARIRYAESAPVLLSRMEREPSRSVLPYTLAHALASMKYKPAIPAIAKLCNTTNFTGDWILAEREKEYLGRVPAVALMRLTADWGDASGGIRLLLLPAGHQLTRASFRAAVVIENVGNEDLDIVPWPGTTIIDGKPFGEMPKMFDGCPTIRVNDVDARAIDLSGLIATPGRHRIQYRLEFALSNTLEVDVQ